MFSHQGLKGIIEFILSNQDRFAIQLKEHTQTLTNLDVELTETLRPLPNAFKDLEEYKRKMLESLKTKLLE
jgi:hypothetical protein